MLRCAPRVGGGAAAAAARSGAAASLASPRPLPLSYSGMRRLHMLPAAAVAASQAWQAAGLARTSLLALQRCVV